MEIIIVGAGIGGLSAALSLALAGHNVICLESASALAEIGAGVQMTQTQQSASGNGVWVLIFSPILPCPSHSTFFVVVMAMS